MRLREVPRGSSVALSLGPGDYRQWSLRINQSLAKKKADAHTAVRTPSPSQVYSEGTRVVLFFEGFQPQLPRTKLKHYIYS